MAIAGAALGLGKRLKWPDDYFTIYNELSYQQYNMNEWPYFLMKNGISNNLSYKFVFGRNSVDSPLFPRRGSNISVSLQATPPYSLLRTETNYSDWEEEEKYKWIEYHKWTFKSEWITKLLATKDLVLYTRYELGFLGYYNKDLRSPFEQYQVGGDGMSGYNMYGSDIVSLRGYENYSLTPAEGGNIYSRFTMELRYPVSLNPQATIYALTFIEAGNAWYNFKDFNPFNLNRSAGVGVRIFLPMLGLLGIDWGYGFDPIPGKANDSGGGQFHFVMGQQF
jgi:outer membrane protein insertion porin family